MTRKNGYKLSRRKRIISKSFSILLCISLFIFPLTSYAGIFYPLGSLSPGDVYPVINDSNVFDYPNNTHICVNNSFSFYYPNDGGWDTDIFFYVESNFINHPDYKNSFYIPAVKGRDREIKAGEITRLELVNEANSVIFTNFQKDSKYKVICYMYSYAASDLSEFTFFPSAFKLGVVDHNGSNHWSYLNNLELFHFDNKQQYGFVAVGEFSYNDLFKIAGNPNISIQNFSLEGSGTIQKRFFFQILIVPQTTPTISALESLHNSVINGNETTGQLQNQADSTASELDNQLQQMESFNNSFVQDFTAQNDVIKQELNKFSFSTQVRNCAKWFNDRFSWFYDNMSEFKLIILAPLLMGAVMLIIRGYTKYSGSGGNKVD